MESEKWRDLVLLSAGESLVYQGMKSEGFMGEGDVEKYHVVDSSGGKVGEVTVIDHTAVRGFRRTITVKQRNRMNELIVNVSYDL